MTYNLTRFLQAQQQDYPLALAEIQSGKKINHWIWYIFPQLKGLGRSEMSEYYGIQDLDEAKAYLANPVLNDRLVQICRALLSLSTNDAAAVMGGPDDIKLKSSMTLFAAVADSPNIFEAVLEKYYHGKKDFRTLALLGLGTR